MNREEFVKEFKEYYFNNKEFNEDFKKLTCDCIKKYKKIGPFSGSYNCTVVMEECGELSQAISKVIRKKMLGEKIVCQKSNEFYDVLQEMADVCLGVLCLQEIFGITNKELKDAMKVKAMREINRPASVSPKE